VFDVNTSTRFVQLGGEVFGVANSGSAHFFNTGFLAWNSTSLASDKGNADLIIRRDAANTLAQRNGTSAQESRLYGTYTSSTVYERLSSKYDSGSGAFVIGTEKGASGGSARPLNVTINGTVVGTFNTSGNFVGGANVVATNQIIAGASHGFAQVGKGVIYFYSDGVLGLLNSASSDFNRLVFGGSTSSFPALQRSGTTIIARLADDTDDTSLRAKTIQLGVMAFSALPSPSTSGIRAFITDSNATAAGNFGAVATGSGGNFAPVYSDGTDWRIG